MSSKQDKKQAEAAPPPPPPPRPPPRKLKAVSVSDVVLDGIVAVNDQFIAAPSLVEAHMYHLEKVLKHSCAQTSGLQEHKSSRSDTASAPQGLSRPPSALVLPPAEAGPGRSPSSVAFVGHASAAPLSGLPPTSGSSLWTPSREGRGGGSNPSPTASMSSCVLPKRSDRFVFLAEDACGSAPNVPIIRAPQYHLLTAQSKAEKLLLQYPPEEANLVRLIAFYKYIHGGSLRVHEEISRNLGINIADLALAEQTLYEWWEKESDMSALLQLAQFTTLTRGGGGSFAGESRSGSTASAARAHSVAALGSSSANSSISYLTEGGQQALPPVSLLVIFLWTCDAADVVDIFFSDTRVATDENEYSRAAANKQLLVSKVRAHMAAIAQRNAEEQQARHRAASLASFANLMSEGTAIEIHHERNSQVGSGAGSTVAEVEDFTRGVRSLDEARLALQSHKATYLLNKWTGTLAMLLATLHRVKEITAPTPTSPAANSQTALNSQPSASSFAAQGTPAALGASLPHNASRPTSGKSSKSVNSILSQDETTTKLVLRCRLMYHSTAEALAALENFCVASPEGYPVPLPPLLSLTASTALIPSTPTHLLRRHEDYEPPNMDVDDAGVQRSFEDKIKLMCSGWYVSPKPPPPPPALDDNGPPLKDGKAGKGDAGKAKPGTDSTKAKPPTPSNAQASATKKKRGSTPGGPNAADLVPITPETEPEYLAQLPKFITVEIVVDHGTDHVIELRSFCTHHPSDDEYVIPPLVQFRFHSVVPEQLKLSLRLFAPPTGSRTDLVPTLAKPFFDRVLADGRKASGTACKICTRLVSQFVKPHHCHRHPKQTYQHFCATCRAFICAACAKETHAVHKQLSISSLCSDIVQHQIQPKVAVLRERVVLLRHLLGELERKRLAMLRTVDAGIDDVKERILRRRSLLHADCDARRDKQLSQLTAERERTANVVQELKTKMNALQQVRQGFIPSEPVQWKKLLSRQILDHLRPVLPTRQVCSLISVLTWSNPSKYLIHVVYPPEAVAASGGSGAEHSDGPCNATGSWLDPGSIKSAGNAQSGSLPSFHAKDDDLFMSIDVAELPPDTAEALDEPTGATGHPSAVESFAAHRQQNVQVCGGGDPVPLGGSPGCALGKQDWINRYQENQRIQTTQKLFSFLAAAAEEDRRVHEARRFAALKQQRRDRLTDPTGRRKSSVANGLL